MPTNTWSSSGSTDWGDSSNWSLARIPQDGDDVVLTGGTAPQTWVATSPSVVAMASFDSSLSADPTGFDSAGNTISSYLSIQSGGYLILQSSGSSIGDQWFGDASQAAYCDLYGFSSCGVAYGFSETFGVLGDYATLHDYSSCAGNFGNNATFLDYAQCGYPFSGGSAAFYDYSTCNEGQISGDVLFTDQSVCGYDGEALISGNCIFDGSATCWNLGMNNGTTLTFQGNSSINSFSGFGVTGPVIWLSTNPSGFFGGTLSVPMVGAGGHSRSISRGR